MGFNFFEMMGKFNQFKTMINQSGKKPEDLLNEEIKRRNISPSQLEDLKRTAQILSNMLGIK